MKTLFIGDHHMPGGPNQVNRNLLKCLPKSIFISVNSTGGIKRRIEGILKIPLCSTIVFSGLMFKSIELKLAKLLRKKIIYIMHGSALLETANRNDKEEQILYNADRILCVSETYSKIIASIYPQYTEKIDVLMNGINWEELDKITLQNSGRTKNYKRIILFGGGRKTKRNLQVCQAVKELNEEKSLGLHIDVYGYYKDEDDSKAISEYTDVSFHHVIPHEEVNIELSKTGLFIQNSEFESFSLAVTDALALGCNVLLSKNVGAKDIICGKTENDIIFDPFDIEELKSKILYVLNNPNNERLLKSINRQETSLTYAADSLIKKCFELQSK